MGAEKARTVRVALAGNPNVGKSTVFNALTGMNQHTGNWAGKTVDNAEGDFLYNDTRYIITDLPGTYSLMAHSAEEAVARDFICFAKPDITIVVCDATCLERNLNLVLQAMEITSNIIICVNLIDEAKKKNICVDIKSLSEQLGVPVVKTCARSKKGLDELCRAMDEMSRGKTTSAIKIPYTESIEIGINEMLPIVEKFFIPDISKRWAALRLLENNTEFIDTAYENSAVKADKKEQLLSTVSEALKRLSENGFDTEKFGDNIVSCIVITAEGICTDSVCCHSCKKANRDRKIDRLLTGKFTGIPIMILMLVVILWITVTGANYPSAVLSAFFNSAEQWLSDFLKCINTPDMINSMLTEGIFRVLTWVISVMLPPMAIFFPLFTLLEDFGVLPRIAFNLDRYFKKAGACGKQGLSMCMSLGCNACGVTGARIIDSKRERLIAIITSSMVPCNGKFPTIISIISMFIIGAGAGIFGGIAAAAALGVVLTAGVAGTLLSSFILSKTLLKGEPSSFTLELPPYRVPQIGKVLVRSFLDRTLFVLGRAVMVAAPAGLIIWIMANVTVCDATLLSHCTAFLDPFARAIGLDGVILFAFILGFPANEIVVPIIIMAYAASGTLNDVSQLDILKEILISNGWSITTAICMITFSLFHFPCSTTCLTVYKETKSIKWTLVSFILPTIMGIALCFIINNICLLIGVS